MKSWEITRAVRDYGPEDPVQRLVLHTLATYADDNGCCWPKEEAIAKNSCISERRARYRLAELKRDGWIIVNPKAAKDHKGNTYQIVLEKLSQRPLAAYDDDSEQAESQAAGGTSHRPLGAESQAAGGMPIRKNDHERPLNSPGGKEPETDVSGDSPSEEEEPMKKLEPKLDEATLRRILDEQYLAGQLSLEDYDQNIALLEAQKAGVPAAWPHYVDKVQVPVAASSTVH